MKKSYVLKFIVENIKPFKFWILGQILVAVIWALDLNFRPFILKVMLDRLSVISHDMAVSQLLGPCALYIGLSLLVVLIFRFQDYIWLNINPGLKRHLGDVLMKRMMLHSQSFFHDHFSGSLGAKIKDVMSGVPDLLKIIIDRFFAQSLALVIAVLTTWTINYKFALSLSIWVFVYISGSILLSKRAKILSQAASEVRSTVVGRIVDILGNMMNVRFFAGSVFESKRLRVDLDKYVAADRKRDWYFLGMFAFQGLSFVVYQIVCIVWLIKGFNDGVISPGDFALILTVNNALVECLWTISKDIGVFASTLGDITQGLSFALTDVEINDKKDASELVVNTGEIVFDRVQFCYKGSKILFEDKSLRIPGGQKVGLVGYSGGGKSTFVNLILRLYELNRGKILIDGQDISEVTQDSLRSNIGIIPQDPLLFHRSLLENLRYGRKEASDEEVIEAAKKAHAHEFIMRLPMQYESLVGERGVKLSGGQRQRIAIARAIIKNAPVLILDEATSQLDSLTETYIQDSLWTLMQGKTTLVVAHRLSTLLDMDRILVFDAGHIVEDGSHQELLSKDGLYKTLWEAQVGGFLPDK